MGESKTWITVALLSCSLSAAAFASADTMTIVYRSGKLQSIAMDEPSVEVQSISYLRTSGSLPQLKVKVTADRPAATGEVGGKTAIPELRKPGVSIKWAPPIDE
jgi:hypothetical protein